MINTLEIFETLQKTNYLKHLSNELLWFMSENVKLVSYNKGDTVYVDNNIFVICNGNLVEKINNQKIQVLYTDDLIGIELLFKKELIYDKYYEVSNKKCELIQIEAEMLKAALEEDHLVYKKILQDVLHKGSNLKSAMSKILQTSGNINSVLEKFNAISKEIFLQIGGDVYQEKYILNKNFNPKLLEKYESKIEKVEIEQFYLTDLDNKYEKRVRRYNQELLYAEKQNTGEGTSKTKEYKIDKLRYQELKSKKVGSIIKKTRYLINGIYPFDLSIDFFKNDHDGLIIAELSFLTSEDYITKNNKPKWLSENIKEHVTKRKEYKNRYLAYPKQ